MWLKEGDRNTNFFHRNVTWRAKKSNINNLKREDGSLTQDQLEMGVLATNFYQKLFTADNSVNPNVIVDDMQRKVTTEMNKFLCEEMTEDEITQALFEIGAQKAPCSLQLYSVRLDMDAPTIIP
jgi:hypothetical protein